MGVATVEVLGDAMVWRYEMKPSEMGMLSQLESRMAAFEGEKSAAEKQSFAGEKSSLDRSQSSSNSVEDLVLSSRKKTKKIQTSRNGNR